MTDATQQTDLAEAARPGQHIGVAEFARAFRHVPGAVAVVLTTTESGLVRGLTCTSATSLSASPPMALFSADAKTRFADEVRTSGRYSINFLAIGFEDWARAFAVGGQSLDSLVHAIHPGRGGAPTLATGTTAVLECALEDIFPGGDHWIVTGRILHARTQSDAPALVYRAGVYGSFAAPPAEPGDAQ
jgi:flavin reductase (DIM6/NTAB) family NADH-FMN oxidoreductase RutF